MKEKRDKYGVSESERKAICEAEFARRHKGPFFVVCKPRPFVMLTPDHLIIKAFTERAEAEAFLPTVPGGVILVMPCPGFEGVGIYVESLKIPAK